MNLISAPIDNKNILEDFTDLFHEGNFVESRCHNLVKQAFYLNGMLFEIVYAFRCHYFRIECKSDIEDTSVLDYLIEQIESMNTDNVIVKHSLPKPNILTCAFYFIVES